MRALPEVEPSPCGTTRSDGVDVTFADGSTITRQTSCTGNALSRVANEVLGVSESRGRGTAGATGCRAGDGIG
jgi:hypothetical protein